MMTHITQNTILCIWEALHRMLKTAMLRNRCMKCFMTSMVQLEQFLLLRYRKISVLLLLCQKRQPLQHIQAE